MRVQVEYFGGATDRAQLATPDLPEIAFIGRSNVGKSSLINCLTNRRSLARTSGTPGRTRALQLFIVDERLFLVDLPGYGYAKASKETRQELHSTIENYLRSSRQLKLVTLIVDARQQASDLDLQMMSHLTSLNLPHIVVATKIDQLPKTRVKPKTQDLQRQLGLSGLLLFSSRTGQGKTDLWRAIHNALK